MKKIKLKKRKKDFSIAMINPETTDSVMARKPGDYTIQTYATGLNSLQFSGPNESPYGFNRSDEHNEYVGSFGRPDNDFGVNKRINPNSIPSVNNNYDNIIKRKKLRFKKNGNNK